jgi:ribose/xylose/arabinose/galactoside ABC-type transport system permease subunit
MSPRTRRVVELLLDNLVWLILVVVLATFSLTVPQYFQFGIFANIIEQSSYVGVMAIGLAMVIIAGHMDLSVESVAALSAMVVGMLFCSAGVGLGIVIEPQWLMVPVSLGISVAIGAAIGLVNGFLVVKLKLAAFIVTLASYIWVRGAERRRLIAIRTSGATANLGIGMLFNAFAAVVIGGISLKGGIGALPGVYAGVLLLSSINTAINLMGLQAQFTQVIHGLLVLAAILLDALKHRIRQRLA